MTHSRRRMYVANCVALVRRYAWALFFLGVVWYGCAGHATFPSWILFAITQAYPEFSNLVLVRQCAQYPEREALWQEFMRRFQEHLRAWALQALGTYDSKQTVHYREAVDDVVQDVYLKLLQNACQALRAFKGETEDALFGYLRVITHHVALNRLRKSRAQKRPQITSSLDDDRASGTDDSAFRIHPKFIAQTTDDDNLLSELQEQINYCLNAVLRGPRKQRDKMLFQLRYFEGLSAEEIAKLPGLNMRPHAIEVAINRVCHRLAKYAKQLKA